jgi:hypothetical protein
MQRPRMRPPASLVFFTTRVDMVWQVTSGMMALDSDTPRSDPDLQADELVMLGQYLGFHRATLELKCAGLSTEQLKRHAVPSST